MTFLKNNSSDFIQAPLLRAKSSAGFTIIELLTAIFILVIGIVGVISVFPLGARVGKYSEMNTVAAQLGQAKMEEITSQSYSEIPVGIIEPKHSLDPPFSIYSRETEVNWYDPVNQTISTTDLGIKKIKVTVTWVLSLGVSQQKVELNTLITKR